MSPVMAWRGHRWVSLLVRLYLGGVFLFACVHKIAEPDTFALDVATYQFLPTVLVSPFALVLPWVEAVCGVLLVLGARVRGAALLVAGMMVSFMVALGWALHVGLDVSCGCFASQGTTQDPISGWTMARDAVWLVMALYILAVDHRPWGVESWLGKRRCAS